MFCGAATIGAQGLRNDFFRPVFCNKAILRRCRRYVRPGSEQLVRSGRSGAGDEAACSQDERSQQDPEEIGERGRHVLTLAERAAFDLIEIKVPTI